jgi:hypothetical protein
MMRNFCTAAALTALAITVLKLSPGPLSGWHGYAYAAVFALLAIAWRPDR